MSIFDSIKNFGSNVISGIGGLFSSPTSTRTAPIVAASTGSITTEAIVSGGINNLINSVFSRINKWVSPNAQAVNTPSPSQQPIVIFGGGASAGHPEERAANEPSDKFFGLSRTTGLLIVAVLIGFLIFKKGKV